MINISGHLREERKITGYCNQDVPLIVNCCGKQVFQTQDYFCNRKNGRLDYQIIYIHRGSGHFYLNNEWITLSAGNIVLYCSQCGYSVELFFECQQSVLELFVPLNAFQG